MAVFTPGERMQPFKILEFPDGHLKEKCFEVREFGTEALRELALRMHATIKHKNSKGFGLAANQVGIMMRVIVINTLTNNKKAQGYLGTLINPEIISYGENIEMGNEGCLSFPDDRYDVARSQTIRVKFQDLNGEPIERNFSGLNAVVVQHEIDHINGVTMKDRSEG